MLSLALRRSKAQLHSHRQWLSAFLTRSPFGAVPHGQDAINSGEHRSPARHARGYAYHTPRHVVKRRRKERELVEAQGQLNEGEAAKRDLLQAITDVDIKRVMKCFEQIPDPSRLDRHVSWRMCQCLHEALRRTRRQNDPRARRESIQELVDFAELLIKHIKQGRLAPDHRAHRHLLGFFTESGMPDGGAAFWQWLNVQDDLFVNSDVYGAAIELLATNGASLTEINEIYERALERFPGNFNAYHLAPNAILANRDEPTIIKGVPMSLLQALLTARLMRGASRDAYLTLDTAVRLYPTQTPARSFGLFIAERPLAEAYTVFAMACRAGILFPYEHIRKLLAAFRTELEVGSLDARIVKLRRVLSVAYMYIGHGGQVTSNLVNAFVITLSEVLRWPGVAPLNSKEKKQVVDAVMDVIRKLIGIFSRYDERPGLSAFNSIIANLAGFGQSKYIIGIALRDAHALGLEPDHVTKRSILTAAGHLADAELIVKSWNELVRYKARDGHGVDATDCHILVKAAKLGGATDVAREVVTYSTPQLSEPAREGLLERLDSDDDERVISGAGALTVSTLLEGLNVMSADLAVMDERITERPGVQDFSEQRLPMAMLPLPDELCLPEPEMRKLYDELTVEPQSAQPELVQPSDALSDALGASLPAVSETNLSFGTLRYENWKSINYLLALAERHDKVYDEAVDKAIADGVAPPSRHRVLQGSAGEAADRIEPSSAARGPACAGSESEWDDARISRARSEILRRRGVIRPAG